MTFGRIHKYQCLILTLTLTAITYSVQCEYYHLPLLRVYFDLLAVKGSKPCVLQADDKQICKHEKIFQTSCLR